MSSLYRNKLPQLSKGLFLTDGGLETTLVFKQNIELPLFASFDLLSIESGKQRLTDYYNSYCEYAVNNEVGFVLESATWRASPDWGTRLGYTELELAQANETAISILEDIRRNHQTEKSDIVISACVGPRGDGYEVARKMSVEEAKRYHQWQINIFSETNADLVTAMTINYLEEAIGIVLAAKSVNMPVAISFTTETDGKLPDGMSLGEAIEEVDRITGSTPVYYMINCAHPDHFKDALDPQAGWAKRIRSIRANASRKSHEELDDSETLDRGDPVEFGQLYSQLRKQFPQLSVFGGCCGTDLSHIQSVHRHCCL